MLERRPQGQISAEDLVKELDLLRKPKGNPIFEYFCNACAPVKEPKSTESTPLDFLEVRDVQATEEPISIVPAPEASVVDKPVTETPAHEVQPEPLFEESAGAKEIPIPEMQTESPRDEPLPEPSTESIVAPVKDEWAVPSRKKSKKVKRKSKKSASDTPAVESLTLKTPILEAPALETPVLEAPVKPTESISENRGIPNAEEPIVEAPSEEPILAASSELPVAAEDEWTAPSKMKGKKVKGKGNQPAPGTPAAETAVQESVTVETPVLETLELAIETQGAPIHVESTTVEPVVEPTAEIPVLEAISETLVDLTVAAEDEWAPPTRKKSKKGKGKNRQSISEMPASEIPAIETRDVYNH
jgi:hypothetical protein